MKINFNSVEDLYQPGVQALLRDNGKIFCPKCRKTMQSMQFFKTSRTDKHPSGFLPECKMCMSMLVDDKDPSTFLSILKEVDVPYIPSQWRSLLAKKKPKDPSIIGKYISKMKLTQNKKYKWADSEKIVAAETESILMAFRQKTDSETEAEEEAEKAMSFSNIGPEITEEERQPDVPQAVLYGLTPETSKYSLTQEEIDQLKKTWGEEYNEDQFLQLEQMFHDMRTAYVIQDPIAISNAKMICKMTAKINKFLDIDDVESVAKLSRQLDVFIKSANLAPVQQKDRQQTTFAISQLAFLVEHEGGFIPEFYTSQPNDKIDQIILDMQDYTESLIHGESNIEEMVENTKEILSQGALPEMVEDYDDFELLEKELLGDIAAIEEQQEEESLNAASN